MKRIFAAVFCILLLVSCASSSATNTKNVNTLSLHIQAVAEEDQYEGVTDKVMSSGTLFTVPNGRLYMRYQNRVVLINNKTWLKYIQQQK